MKDTDASAAAAVSHGVKRFINRKIEAHMTMPICYAFNVGFDSNDSYECRFCTPLYSLLQQLLT